MNGDQPLRCNSQSGGVCRTPLKDQAVVTTCSHIFCLPCAKKIGFLDQAPERRQCPTCKTPLHNDHDAVINNLKPSEEYKTSVLSGLDPTTIMECAGRALAFWTYQTTQEIFYQEYLGKSLTEKYTNLSTAMDKLVHEANGEIKILQEKIQGLAIDKQELSQKNNELCEMYREKSRRQTQTQQLYDTLKKRVLAKQVQTAASQQVDQTLQSLNAANRPETYDDAGLHTSRMHELHIPNDAPVRPRGATLAEQHGLEQLHNQQRASSSIGQRDPAHDSLAMPPPPGFMSGDRLADPQFTGTPLQRNGPFVHPGTIRQTANRTNIPLSGRRGNIAHEHHFGSAQSPAYNTSRSGLNTANGHFSGGGILGGMKVSRDAPVRDTATGSRHFSTNGLNTHNVDLHRQHSNSLSGHSAFL